MIEEGENVLRDLGFREVRVRHHELRGQDTGALGRDMPLSNSGVQGATHLARIELGANEIPRLLGEDAFAKVADALKRIGYAHVTLDLAGYRRGSLNETSIAFPGLTESKA
jgi:uncharacterized protein